MQVGTAFAFCKESGLREDLREQVVQAAKLDACHVHTDPLASPAGFPFKVLSIPGTMSEKEQLAERLKVCDLGFLRQGYRASDGTIGWRCPAEPVASFVRKEGTVEETVGRKCLCNGLIANVGMGQVRKNGELELPLVTCGDDVSMLASYLPNRQAVSYSAHDVIQFLLSAIEPEDAIVPSLMSTTES